MTSLRERINLVKCGLLDHRWGEAVIAQFPTRRIVERRCRREGCTAHMLAMCDVWSEPTRAAFTGRVEAAS